MNTPVQISTTSLNGSEVWVLRLMRPHEDKFNPFSGRHVNVQLRPSIHLFRDIYTVNAGVRHA